MLTLAMPQSDPAAERNCLGLAQVVGEDRRRQALRHVVVHRDRVLEALVAHHVEDGREGLVPHDGRLRRHLDDGRAHVVRIGPGLGERALAAVDLAALLAPPRPAPTAWPRRRHGRSAGPPACRARADRRWGASRRPCAGARPGRRARSRARSAGAWWCSAGPAVPAAAKRMPRTARSRSAEGVTIIALLPPSSSRQRPKRCATRGPTSRPMRVLPVADTSATRASSTIASPMSRRPIATHDSPAGASAPKRRAARSNRAWQASAVSGVFSDGFHTTASPQTMASAEFHAHTATGKLKALMTPTTPSGCQLSIMRWPGRSDGDGQAMQLARQADREVADVDHLLHLAQAFGEDLAGLERDQRAERRPSRRAAPRRTGGSARRAAAPARCARPGRRIAPRRPCARRRRPCVPGAGPARCRRWASARPADRRAAPRRVRPGVRAGSGSGWREGSCRVLVSQSVARHFSIVLFQRAFQPGRFALMLSQSTVTAFFIHSLIFATCAPASPLAGVFGLVGIWLPYCSAAACACGAQQELGQLLRQRRARCCWRSRTGRPSAPPSLPWAARIRPGCPSPSGPPPRWA